MGSGKSLLMDMFFAEVEAGDAVPLRRRLHFNAAMLEARGQYTPFTGDHFPGLDFYNQSSCQDKGSGPQRAPPHFSATVLEARGPCAPFARLWILDRKRLLEVLRRSVASLGGFAGQY